MDKKNLLERFNALIPDTLLETLHIRFTDVGADYLVAEMPVSPRVHQPMGLLHGGATIALAESVGSAASALLVSPESYRILGVSLSVNHIKSIKEGIVTARADLVHPGRTTHVWNVEVKDENGQLVSVCRITNMILPK